MSSKLKNTAKCCLLQTVLQKFIFEPIGRQQKKLFDSGIRLLWVMLTLNIKFLAISVALFVSTSCSSARSTERSGFKLVFDMRYSDIQKLILENDRGNVTVAELDVQIQMESVRNCVPYSYQLPYSFTYVGWNTYPREQPMSGQILRDLSCDHVGRPELRADWFPVVVYFQNPRSDLSRVDLKTWGSKSELAPDPFLKNYVLDVQNAFPINVDRCQIITTDVFQKGVRKKLFIALTTYPDPTVTFPDDRLLGQVMCSNIPLFLSAGIAVESLPSIFKESKTDGFRDTLTTSNRLLVLVRDRILGATDISQYPK